MSSTNSIIMMSPAKKMLINGQNISVRKKSIYQEIDENGKLKIIKKTMIQKDSPNNNFMIRIII